MLARLVRQMLGAYSVLCSGFYLEPKRFSLEPLPWLWTTQSGAEVRQMLVLHCFGDAVGASNARLQVRRMLSKGASNAR